MLVGTYVFVVFLTFFVIRNLRGTCSSIKMLKVYMARVSLGTPALKRLGRVVNKSKLDYQYHNVLLVAVEGDLREVDELLLHYFCLMISRAQQWSQCSGYMLQDKQTATV